MLRMRWIVYGLLGLGLLGAMMYGLRGVENGENGANGTNGPNGMNGSNDGAVEQVLQLADLPPVIAPEDFDPRMILLSGPDRFLVPTIGSIVSPLGTAEGAMTYDAQTFGEMNEARGGKHLGYDLNGVGGENTDLGDPVYAAADGLVIYVGEPSPGWGKVLVLAHRLPDGRFIQTLYGHLEKTEAVYGETVGQGRVIGRVGTAGGKYWAHLHFEVIDSCAHEAGAPAYAETMGNRLSLAEIIEQDALKTGFFTPDDIFLSLEAWFLEGQQSQLRFRVGESTE